ncbi:MAG: hypothetical protein H7Z17_00070 [Fuerstia sp.]|nr:hypothetical protein [Fuerstiella sp.]
MTEREPTPDSAGSAPTYWRRILLVATFAVILAAVLLFPFPQTGRYSSQLFNLAHAPSFFATFLLVAGLLDPSCIGFSDAWHRILPLGVVRLMILVSVLLVVGVACEVLQGFVGRSPSVSDVMANGCGLVAGLFWCFGRRQTARLRRIGLSMIAGGLLLTASLSSILELYDCWLQHRDFPLLASFERSRELHTWHAQNATIEPSAEWQTDGSASLEVRGLAGKNYSGANFLWPIADWRGFTALELDVFNPGGNPLTLKITISDNLHAATGYESTDRFATSVELPPQQDVHIRIELKDVENSPATRQMDLSQINSLNLFIGRPKSDFVFMLDNVRLVKD